MTIVGVVGHAAHEGLDADPRIQYYLPASQAGGRFMSVAVSTKGDPHGVIAGVRNVVHRVDAGLPIANISTMEQLVDRSVGQRKLSMILLGVFSGIALLLASIGIYGVMSYAVAQRTNEIGIRLALGAQTRDVLSLIIGQGLRLVLVGLAIGLLGAFALMRVISGLLFGVTAKDPMTFIVVSVVLAVIALLACYVPARRATRVDPLEALRYE